MAEEIAPPVAVPPASAADGRLPESTSRGRLVIVLITVVLLSEIIPFTYSLAMVLTPLVGRSFPAAGAQVSWMVTIIGIVGGATIVLVTKAADLWGKKRVMLISAVIFWIGTIICATTSVWALFLVGRGLEGIAIAMSALCYSLLRDVMPRSWVPVTIGFIGTGIGISGVGAPLIGGVLADTWSWRAVFWFMAIYMAVAIALFVAIVPESTVRKRQKLDVPGVIMVGLGVTGVLLYLSEGPAWGWAKPASLVYLIAGVVLLALFLWWQTKTSAPTIDLKLARQPKVAGLLLFSFIFTGTYTAFTYMPSFMYLSWSRKLLVDATYAQAIAAAPKGTPASVLDKLITFRGDIGFGAGFDLFQFAFHILLVGGIIGMILGPVSAAWARRAGGRVPAIVGMAALIVAGAGLIAWHSWVPGLIFFVAASVGMGMYYGTAPNMLVDVVPREEQTIIAGAVAGVGSIGSSFMTAILTAILASFPFEIVAMEPKGAGGTMVPVVTKVPDIYTSTGFMWGYVAGLIGAVLCLIIALRLRAGREPAQGGLLE
jgi:MFS family permease